MNLLFFTQSVFDYYRRRIIDYIISRNSPIYDNHFMQFLSIYTHSVSPTIVHSVLIMLLLCTTITHKNSQKLYTYDQKLQFFSEFLTQLNIK